MNGKSDLDSVWSVLREIASALYGLGVTYALFVADLFRSGGWGRLAAVGVVLVTIGLAILAVLVFRITFDSAWLSVRQTKAMLLRKESPVGSTSAVIAGRHVEAALLVEVTGYNLLFGLPEGEAWIEVPVRVYERLDLGASYCVDYTRTRWGGEIKIVQIYA